MLGDRSSLSRQGLFWHMYTRFGVGRRSVKVRPRLGRVKASFVIYYFGVGGGHSRS